MAIIRRPPPLHTPDPQFHTVPAGKTLVRIFNPNRYGATATQFRSFGPMMRFDHHTRKDGKPWINPHRAVWYGAFELSCCVVEVFGDRGVIEFAGEQVGLLTPTRNMRLLDLRGSAAMRAGTVAAVNAVQSRRLSQHWSWYFYKTPCYQNVDGLIYHAAHNSEEAIVLYERAADALTCSASNIYPLNTTALRPTLLRIARGNNLILL